MLSNDRKMERGITSDTLELFRAEKLQHFSKPLFTFRFRSEGWGQLQGLDSNRNSTARIPCASARKGRRSLILNKLMLRKYLNYKYDKNTKKCLSKIYQDSRRFKKNWLSSSNEDRKLIPKSFLRGGPRIFSTL